MTFEEMDAAKSGPGKPTPFQLEVERLQARVKQIVDEALASSPMDPAQLRLAVIRQLALDIDPDHEPDMEVINAEIRAFRRARRGNSDE